ncbi:MAG: NgoFVII family restriction endonuclease [Treponemataceae bacterium]|nr:NgoFVII family restriction endonuclease [Treponemataceae bacterium]
MLELLNSNYMPVNTGGQTFEKVFFDHFDASSKLTAASGYVSEDSIADLLMLYKTGAKTRLELIVGMHLFEGFSFGQYDALCNLNKLLKNEQLGAIYVSSSFKYHGKVYLFQDANNRKVSILGSSNITKLSPVERIYDTDIVADDADLTNSIENLLLQLRDKGCEAIDKIDSKRLKILPPENLFEDYLSVKKVKSDELAEIQPLKTETKFDILLKDEEKSNLNVYFGKPRVNFSNGSKLPRPWYEVELIVSKKVTGRPDYPKPNTEFTVITDDGYSFDCKVSGDFAKNFRSAGDLSILGRWIKGRMENKKALSIGERVTESTFQKYGRNTITLTKTKKENVWFLDFGV